MNLQTNIIIFAGGVGSGCNPAVGKCGRTITLYHGTTEPVAHSIVKNGLKPGRSNWEVASSHYHGRGKIYLARSVETAHYFGQEASDPGGEKGNKKYGVVRVEVPLDVYKKMQPDPENKKDWLRYKGALPANMVTHVGIYKPGHGGMDSKVVKMLKGDENNIENNKIVPADTNKFSSMLDELSQDKKTEITPNFITVADSSKFANKVKSLEKMGYLQKSGKSPVGRFWGVSYAVSDTGKKLFNNWFKKR